MTAASDSLPFISTFIAIVTFLAIANGFIFKDSLEYQVERWNRNRATQTAIEYQRPHLIFAYLCLTFFLFCFVAACLSVFQIGYLLAIGLGAAVVLPLALLIWVQLGSMLALLVKGGSRAIDIDTFAPPELPRSEAGQ